MKLKGIYKASNLLTFLLIVLVLILAAALTNNYFSSNSNSVQKARDAVRISDIDNIHNAIRQYYAADGRYPACLYQADCTHSLEAADLLQPMPKDPLTNIEYSYAAFGTGANCQGYHLGGSLERTGSQALLTGADAPMEPANALCTSSKPDFSGLSYANGGEPCGTQAGSPEPSNSPDAETCYDLAHTVAQPAH